MKKQTWPLFILIGTIFSFAASSLFAKMAGQEEDKNLFESQVSAYHKSNPEWKRYEVKKDFPLDKITRIEVKTLASDISISRVDSNNINLDLAGSFENQNEDSILSVVVNGDKMIVEVHEQAKKNKGDFNFVFGGVSFGGKLKIALPEQVKDIEIASASGEVNIDGSTFGMIKTQTASGDTKISAGRVQSLKTDSASGDLKVNGEVVSIDSDSASGDFTFMLKNNDPRVKVDSASGDVKIALKDPDVEINFDSMSGEVKVDDSLVSNKSKDKMILKNGRGSIDVDTMSGDLKIEKLTE